MTPLFNKLSFVFLLTLSCSPSAWSSDESKTPFIDAIKQKEWKLAYHLLRKGSINPDIPQETKRAAANKILNEQDESGNTVAHLMSQFKLHDGKDGYGNTVDTLQFILDRNYRNNLVNIMAKHDTELLIREKTNEIEKAKKNSNFQEIARLKKVIEDIQWNYDIKADDARLDVNLKNKDHETPFTLILKNLNNAPPHQSQTRRAMNIIRGYVTHGADLTASIKSKTGENLHLLDIALQTNDLEFLSFVMDAYSKEKRHGVSLIEKTWMIANLNAIQSKIKGVFETNESRLKITDLVEKLAKPIPPGPVPPKTSDQPESGEGDVKDK